MGVSFTASTWEQHPKYGRVLSPMFSCDCSRRWCDDCDAAWARDETAPAMYTCDVCDNELDVNCSNARDLLTWVGVDVGEELCGSIEAPELAARCRRRLWDESRNHDPAMTGDERAESLGLEQSERVITCGRSADYLRRRCADLLRVAETAGTNFVAWG